MLVSIAVHEESREEVATHRLHVQPKVARAVDAGV